MIDAPGPAAPRIADTVESGGICGRTLQVREAIVALIEGVTDCADVTDAHLAGITGTLDLSSSSIAALGAGDFAGLSSVLLLDLHDNALTTLPPGLLAGLSRLEVLYLDGNALTALPADLMDPVPRLKEIWARNNALTGFPPGFFAGHRELTELQIYHNPGDPTLKALDPIDYHRGNPLGVHVSLQALGQGRFKFLVPVGTAFETVVTLDATNGVLADDTITIPAGRVESDVFVVAREDGTSEAVTVDATDVRAGNADTRPPWYPHKLTPQLHNGVVIAMAGDLPAEVHPAREPRVSVAARRGGASVTEGAPAVFTLTRDRPHDGALTVSVDVAQTGEVIKTAGSYRAPAGVEFGAGEGTATLTVQTQADGVDEARGTITATVTAAASDPYTAGEPATAGVMVEDDDETVPTVAAVSLSSDPPESGAYAIGDTVRATVDFSVGLSGPLTVGGRPQLALGLGTATRQAAYESGSGSTSLVFAYTVAEGDAAAGGIAVAANSLRWNRGVIANFGGIADLSHAALAAQRAHAVDGVRPALVGAATSEDGRSVVLTYSETLDPADPPSGSAFTVTMNGERAHLSGGPAVAGAEVTLPLTAPLRHGAPVAVGYTAPSAADGAGAVRDRFGNGAASANVTVTNNVVETAGPSVDLVLEPAAVAEAGGVSTVTAVLTGPAPAPFEVTVAATAVPPAAADGFSLSENATLSFAAGATASTGTVQITAVDNDAAEGDKAVRVSGTAADGSGVETPPDRTLTIRDDEAPFVEVCDRTAEVRDELVQATRAGACGRVTQAGLGRIEQLDLRGAGISSLRSGDFSGLTGVESILLNSNQLRTLPADVFHGLPRLRTLYLHGNPSMPVPPGVFVGLTGLIRLRLHLHRLPVGLERVASGRFKATIATGAPFDLAVQLTVTNGALPEGAASVTIPAGSVASGVVAVARTGREAVQVDIAGLPTPPAGHRYYSLVKAAALPLVVADEIPNTEPTITTSSPLDTAENQTAVATLEASDPDAGHAFAWSKAGGADADRFDLSSGGVLSFVPAPDYEAPADSASTDPSNPAGNNEYVVTVEVADGQGGSARKTLVVRVADQDEIPPQLLAGAEGATVDWDELTLRWNEALDGASSPGTSAFAVDVAGRPRAVTKVSVSGSTAVLTLASAVAAGDAVQASYTAPAGSDAHPIRDEAGNNAAAVANRAVSNETPRVTLVLSPAGITESGASNQSTVSATLSAAAPAAFTVTVSASAVAPTVAGDFVLSAGPVLSFDRGAVSSRGTVTVTAVDNAADTEDRAATVSGTLSEGARVTGPETTRLTIADDDEKPGAPAGLHAAAGDERVTLTWTAPEHGRSVTGYEFRYCRVVTPTDCRYEQAAPTGADWYPTESATSHTVMYWYWSTGGVTHRFRLANGLRYRFEVRAVAGDEVGAAAVVEAAPTAGEDSPEPGPPTNLQASGVTHDAVTLSWDAPAGSTVTGYQVLIRYKDRDPAGRFAVLVQDTGSTATTHRVTRLSPSTRHVFRVKAHTADGRLSARSMWVDVDTPAAGSDSGAAEGAAGLDADGTAEGAAGLDADAAARSPWYLHGQSLDRAGGDAVDYFAFTIDQRYELGLGVRAQSIDLDVTLEDAQGDALARSQPPPGDPTIEWLKTVIEPGTYFIRVEAKADGATSYYIRFGLVN